MVSDRINAIVAIVLIIVATLLHYWLIPTFVVENINLGMSPRFFPELGAIIIGAFSGLLLFSSLWNILKSDKISKEEVSDDELHTYKLKPFYVVGVISLFIIMFQKLGYPIAAPIAIALLMLVFDDRRWPFILIISVAVSAILFVVFNYGLNLSLM